MIESEFPKKEQSSESYKPREQSSAEKRVRKLTYLYYSRPEIQKAIYNFSKNREISPRYFEGFGKRPDSFQYPTDVFNLVKKGATSFHCSEEIWKDPMKITREMTPSDYNEIRIGWDLLIDIDCKWIDYSKLAAQSIINVFKNSGIKAYSIKFSGSKGFHILLPWKTFPQEINGEPIKNLFPEIPRKLVEYIRNQSQEEMQKILPSDFYKQFKDVEIKRGIKCNNCGEIAHTIEQLDLFCENCGIGEIRNLEKNKEKQEFKCPQCSKSFIVRNKQEISSCEKCQINSKINPEKFSQSMQIDLFELMGLDLVLVSPRHLFRMPYSLHEKTALASIPLTEQELENFQLPDADPMKISQDNIRNFYPESEQGEARELLLKALDWHKDHEKVRDEDESIYGTDKSDFKKQNKIKLFNVKEDQFPPCVKLILQGMKDGRKRGLFILLNFFRSIGLEKQDFEKIIEEWNKKNEVPLKEGYIKSQLEWNYRKKPLMPPNCREFYKNIGVCQPDKLCEKIKNPINYTIKKNWAANNRDPIKKLRKKKN
jgi:hypothetical protein